MENTNEKVNETREDLVSVTYQGSIYEITKQEYEDLKDGYITAKEMFE